MTERIITAIPELPPSRAPNFSSYDWQRLCALCPIERSGEIKRGGFLTYEQVSQSELSIARIAGGCTIGAHRFIYMPQHDMLLRVDFYNWALRNWRKVLFGTPNNSNA